MAFKRVSSRLVKITRRLAEEWSKMPAYSHDRSFKQGRSDSIHQDILAGKFSTCEWISAEWQGESYRIQGQHTSHAIKGCPESVLKGLMVTISHFECDSIEDMGILWSTKDRPSSAHTSSETNRFFANAHPEVAALNSRVLNALVGGLGYSYWGLKNADHSAEQRALLPSDNVPFCRFAAALLGGGVGQNVSHLRRSPVIAAMHQTFKVSSEATNEFWQLVSTGAALDRNDASRVLQMFLITNVIGGGGGRGGGFKNSVSRQEAFAKCIIAWNNWRKGLKIAKLQWNPAHAVPKAK